MGQKVNFRSSEVSQASFSIIPKYGQIDLYMRDLNIGPAGEPVTNITISMNVSPNDRIITPINSDFIGTDIARTADIPSIKGLATEQYVNDAVASVGDPASIKVNGTTYTKDDSGLITLPDYPVLPEHIVNLVNGKDGTVTLYAKDITAENTNTIQANLDRLDSDISRVESSIPDTSGFITSTELNAAIQTKQDVLVNSQDIVVAGNKVTTVYGGGYTEEEKRLYHNCPKLETYNPKYNNYTGTGTSDITWVNEHLELRSRISC